MAEVTEVTVPDIGDFTDVPVIEVLVKPGDAVQEEDPLVTLESDKATMEVPSPAAGTVAEIKVEVGDTVSEGTRRAHARGRQRRAGRRAGGADRAEGRGAGGARSRRTRAGCCRTPTTSTRRPSVRRRARQQGIDLTTDHGLRPRRPHHPRGPGGGRARGARGNPRVRPRGRCLGAPTAAPRTSAWRSRASRRSAGRGCRRRGRRSRTSPSTTRRTSPTSRRSASRSTPSRTGEGDDGRADDEGVRRLAEGVPRRQLEPRRRRADPQALLPPRLRGGHAQRPARPRHPRRRPQGHPRRRRRAEGALRPRPRGQAQGRGDARRDVHDLLASAASAGRSSRRSSTRPRSPSSASRARRPSRSGTARSSCRA